MFIGAVEYARRRGTHTTDGIFLRRFATGTYVEYQGRMLWSETTRLREACSADYFELLLVSIGRCSNEPNHVRLWLLTLSLRLPA